MEVIDPGHEYKLQWLDGEHLREPFQYLRFVKREGEKYPGNVGHHPGTTIQEVCRALIDRLQYVHRQIPHEANERSIQLLRGVIWDLERRAAERHGRLERFQQIILTASTVEKLPTCPTCGHLFCEEHKQGASER